MQRYALTLHDYPSMAAAVNNPPACMVPWSSLDLDRITALGGLADAQCGTCARVCGSAGCETLLIVDRAAQPGQLDISTGAGPKIVGDTTGRHRVTMKILGGARACHGIWNGKMFWDHQEPFGGWAARRRVRARDEDGSAVEPGQEMPEPSSPHVSSALPSDAEAEERSAKESEAIEAAPSDDLLSESTSS